MMKIALAALVVATATPALAFDDYQDCTQVLTDMRSIDRNFTRILNSQKLTLVVANAPESVVETNTMTRSAVEVVLGNYLKEFSEWCETLRTGD